MKVKKHGKNVIYLEASKVSETPGKELFNILLSIKYVPIKIHFIHIYIVPED